MSGQDYIQLTLFQDDSLASRSVSPGSEEAKRMTVISGRKCLELYKKSGPLGLLVRMLLGSSIWRSTLCYLTWKASATPRRRLLFRLVPSMPGTEETDALFWRTPSASDGEGGVMEMRPDTTGHYKLRDHVHPINKAFWPTPTANQCGMTATTSGRPIEKSTKLGTQVYLAEKLFTTPTAADTQGTHGGGNHSSLRTDVGGQLNPTWVEWLMGFPLGWTDLNA